MSAEMTEGWLPMVDIARPADLCKCRFELFPAPGGIIAIFAADHDAAGRVFGWVVGQALIEKDSQREEGADAPSDPG